MLDLFEGVLAFGHVEALEDLIENGLGELLLFLGGGILEVS